MKAAEALEYVNGFRWRDQDLGWDWDDFKKYIENDPRLLGQVMSLVDKSVVIGMTKMYIGVTPPADEGLPDYMVDRRISFTVEFNEENGFAEGYIEDVYQLIANGPGY